MILHFSDVQYDKLNVRPVGSEATLLSANAESPGLVLVHRASAKARRDFSFAAMHDFLLHEQTDTWLRDCGPLSPKELKKKMMLGKVYDHKELEEMRAALGKNADRQLVREMDYTLRRMDNIKRYKRSKPELHVSFNPNSNPHTHVTTAVTITLCCDEDEKGTTQVYDNSSVVELDADPDFPPAPTDQYDEQEGWLKRGKSAAYAPRRLDAIKTAPGVWHGSPRYKGKPLTSKKRRSNSKTPGGRMTIVAF